jgi:hypothetical protein
MSRPLLRIVKKTGPGRRFPRVVPIGLLAVMVLLSAAPGGAQPAVRQVLMLQSFDRGTLPVDHFTSEFRVELDKRSSRANIDSSSFPTRRSCSRRSIDGFSTKLRQETTKPLSRSTTSFRAPSRPFSNCCPRPGRCSW